MSDKDKLALLRKIMLAVHENEEPTNHYLLGMIDALWEVLTFENKEVQP